MGREDWYRRAAWSPQDREDFHARLKRSRGSSNKAQYLRIQALYLEDAGHVIAAIELLDQMLTDYPDLIEIASAHLQKANCFAKLGQDKVAVEEFRAALQAERDFPHRRTMAWLDFGCFVVERQLIGLYDEIEETLREFRDDADETLRFPSTEYRYYVIRAHLAEANGDLSAASEFAARALHEADKSHSGLPRHPDLGLVGSERHKFEKKLNGLVSKSTRLK